MELWCKNIREKRLNLEGFSRGEGVHAHTSAVLGTSSQKISHLISPTFVCKVTDCKQIQLNPQINIQMTITVVILIQPTPYCTLTNCCSTHSLDQRLPNASSQPRRDNTTRNTTLTIVKTPRSTWKVLVLNYKPNTPNVSFFQRQLSLRMQPRRKTNE